MGATGARAEARHLGTREAPGGAWPHRLGLVLSVLLLGAALLASPASAFPGHLAGTWTSVDTDGSNQTMRIRGAGHPVYAMTLRDDFTTGACGGPPAKVVGRARADGNALVMRGTLVCLHRGNPIPGQRVTVNFDYHAGSDTLTDDAGVVWVRAS